MRINLQENNNIPKNKMKLINHKWDLTNAIKQMLKKIKKMDAS